MQSPNFARVNVRVLPDESSYPIDVALGDRPMPLGVFIKEIHTMLALPETLYEVHIGVADSNGSILNCVEIGKFFAVNGDVFYVQLKQVR